MFIGHFAVGFGAKKYAPILSLGFLFIAAQFLDLLWPILLLFNLEQVVIEPGTTKMTPLDFTHYPYTHSLLFALLWSLLGTGLTYLLLKKIRPALVIGICIISHWFLDFLVHRPDLPIMPDEAYKVGLGLWNHPVVAIVLEFIVFIVGVLLYQRHTKPISKFGNYGFIGLVLFLFLIYLANIFGPPPPDVQSIAWAGQLQWLFVILAFYVDKHRVFVQTNA
ncbi:MAG: hypothetical protein KDC53_11690 [Saprospiraceae bacterium]|nr:hypothetical protein [Saprospiraceae bacterium]